MTEQDKTTKDLACGQSGPTVLLGGWQHRDTMPGITETFLVGNDRGQVAPMIRGIIHNNVGTSWDWNYGESVTCWMPLPPPPNAGNKPPQVGLD